MITKVVLAKLSPTMEEGTIVKWTKNEGDAVKVGDVLAEIETDKANMEMEALGDGVLRKILVPAGDRAPVGALIGVVAGPDEDIAPLLAEAKAVAPAPPAAPSVAAAPAPSTPSPAPPPAAPLAAPAAAPPAGPPAAPAADSGRVKASPLARAMAAERSLPLASIPGTGPGGRVIKRDIEGYLAAPPAPVPTVPGAAARARPAIPVPSVPPGTAIPLSGMRRTIARRLSESMFTAPHFYVTVEVDMGAAAILRAEIEDVEGVRLSYNDLVVKASAKALTRFPTVNASWTGESIQTHAEVHVGVAVSLPDGLLTPVVRNADRKSILVLSREIKDLATRARGRKLQPQEYTGSTFTVSNLGMFDVTEFTAIINPPESCILAVGAVRKLPVVADDEITIGQRMKLTLSSDHRVVDGVLAAQFLAEVRRLLESPVGLLL